MGKVGARRKRSRRLTPRAVSFCAALLAVASLAACTAAAGGPRDGGRNPALQRRRSPSRPAAFGIGLGLVTWREPGRSTENFYSGVTTAGRVLKVEILYPSVAVPAATVRALAAPAVQFGPYPVVVFAHGYDLGPDTYRALLDAWVEAGFVVVAPFFPDTSNAAVAAQHGVDTEDDMFNQPGDIAFVVSQVVAAANGSAATRIGYLRSMFDPARLILAGQSDGGDTVAALMYDTAYASLRESLASKPAAVAILSGAEWSRSEDDYPAGRAGPPVLVVQSLADACNEPPDSSQLYNSLRGPKWFLTLISASHLGPYVGFGAGAVVVERTTVGFFDLALGLGGKPRTVARDGYWKGVSTITDAAQVPVYPDAPWSADPCALPEGVPAN